MLLPAQLRQQLLQLLLLLLLLLLLQRALSSVCRYGRSWGARSGCCCRGGCRRRPRPRCFSLRRRSSSSSSNNNNNNNSNSTRGRLSGRGLTFLRARRGLTMNARSAPS
jgi:hypothetical protein